MPEYNPLVLEIVRQQDVLRMSVCKQQELISTLRHYSQVTVSFSEVNRLCHEMSGILTRAERIEPSPALVNELAKAGQVLWDMLLSKPVKEYLRKTQATELVISIDEGLVHIPWELLYDGSNFLCLNFNIGRLVRTAVAQGVPLYRSANEPMRMLILANPTEDLRAAYLEGVHIRNQFDRQRSKMRIDFKSSQIDKLYVKKNIADYDIVHYAGHCEYEDDAPGQSGWLFTDGRLSAQDVLAMGSAQALPTLVFSNACYSAKSDVQEQAYCEEANFSLAAAFLHSGVRHYIGSSRKIEDLVSLDFAREFYAQLIAGRSVGESVKSARLKLVKDYGINKLHWASYVLYGDPAHSLFAARKMPQAKKRFRLAFSKQVRMLTASAVAALGIIAGFLVWAPSIHPTTYYTFRKSQQLFRQGKNDLAIEQLKGIIQKDPSFLAVYPFLAQSCLKTGQRECALRYYFEYMRISEKLRDRKHLASAYTGLGWLYHSDGDYAKAQEYYLKAIDTSRQARDALAEAEALRKMAVWYIDKGDYDRALELLTKSSEINREHQLFPGFRQNLARDYFDIGLVFSNKEDFDAARKFYEKSRLLFERLNLVNELSDCYFNLGEIYLFKKEFHTALDFYQRGLALDEAQGSHANLPSDYLMLGELYAEMDDLVSAEGYFLKAVEAAQAVKLKPDLAQAYFNLGMLYKKMNKKTKARENLRLAQEIFVEIDPARYEQVRRAIMDMSSG